MKLTLTDTPGDNNKKGTRKLVMMCLNFIDKNLSMIDSYEETPDGIVINYGTINGSVSAMMIVKAIKDRSKKGFVTCLSQ